jgi:hypothetical protein
MAKHVYVFNARLDGWRGVRRTIAVRTDQTLAHLHAALQAAFDWDDDHLYAFWLGGKFRARDDTEYVHPFALEADPFAGWDLPIARASRKSATRRLDRLRLTKGQQIAYVFDFGDEWRVRLTLREITADDTGPYLRILESVGEAPPPVSGTTTKTKTPPDTNLGSRRSRLQNARAMTEFDHAFAAVETDLADLEARRAAAPALRAQSARDFAAHRDLALN